MKILPTAQFEKALWEQGFFYVAGLDEAGRGAWAGPVSAGAVIFPIAPHLSTVLNSVRDSKKMSASEREKTAEKIMEYAISWGIGFASHEEIDRIGILPATRLAMDRAIANLRPNPDHLLIDAVFLPRQMTPQQSIIRGDEQCISIAAASILAKTARDHWMCREAAKRFPLYGFEQHKGYGTSQHQQALQEYGPCEIHRKTFKPIASDLSLF